MGPGRTASQAGQHCGQRRKRGIQRHEGGHELKMTDRGQVPPSLLSTAQIGRTGKAADPACWGPSYEWSGNRRKERRSRMEMALKVLVREAEWKSHHSGHPSEGNLAAVRRKSK